MADKDPGTVVIESLVKEFHERRKDVLSTERPVSSRRRTEPDLIKEWYKKIGYNISRIR